MGHPSPNPPSFTSGFLDWTVPQIRTWVDAHIPETGNLAPHSYVLVDARTARDHTVVLGPAYSTLHDRDAGDMTEDEYVQWEQQCEAHDGLRHDAWGEWRVRGEEAERMVVDLVEPNDFSPKLFRGDWVAAHTEAQGVFRRERAFEAMVARDLAEARRGDGEVDGDE